MKIFIYIKNSNVTSILFMTELELTEKQLNDGVISAASIEIPEIALDWLNTVNSNLWTRRGPKTDNTPIIDIDTSISEQLIELFPTAELKWAN